MLKTQSEALGSEMEDLSMIISKVCAADNYNPRPFCGVTTDIVTAM